MTQYHGVGAYGPSGYLIPVAFTTYGVWGDARSEALNTPGPGGTILTIDLPGYGVLGSSSNANHGGAGVVGLFGFGRSEDAWPSIWPGINAGVAGLASVDEGPGVLGQGHTKGVLGQGQAGAGVQGAGDVDPDSLIVPHPYARGTAGVGVAGEGFIGVMAVGWGEGLRALNSNDTNIAVSLASGGGDAAQFAGSVICFDDLTVFGPLSKPGGGFKIDHPLDPANKYLSHSFVESPDMKNIYDGIAFLDTNGEAVIELPEWLEALNKDFRYQLTPIGTPGPSLHIAEKISNNRFKIAGGTPDMEVSWQVTGTRKDQWAEANRIMVEEEKPADEHGYYLHPGPHGVPEEHGIVRRRRTEIGNASAKE